MRRCISTASNYFEHHLKNELVGIKTAGTFKNERVIHGKQGVLVNVSDSCKMLDYIITVRLPDPTNQWSTFAPTTTWDSAVTQKSSEQDKRLWRPTELVFRPSDSSAELRISIRNWNRRSQSSMEQKTRFYTPHASMRMGEYSRWWLESRTQSSLTSWITLQLLTESDWAKRKDYDTNIWIWMIWKPG